MNLNISPQTSLKRLAISKANAQMVAVAAVAAFITVFCIVGSNYLLGTRSYQARILAADHVADNKLKADVNAKDQLLNSYDKFVAQNPNLLGTNNSTNNNVVYNNATIILDALPSQYDFPALTTTIQKILQSGNFDITSIGGSDESSTISNSGNSNPQAVSMPFSFEISNASYSSVQQLFQVLQQSIRPLQIDNMTLSGSDTNMSVTVNAHTYFQPEKTFKINSQVIPR